MKVEKLTKNGQKGQNCYPLSPGEIGKKDSRKLNRRPIEIQLKKKHFVALLRRAEINEPWESKHARSIPTFS